MYITRTSDAALEDRCDSIISYLPRNGSKRYPVVLILIAWMDLCKSIQTTRDRRIDGLAYCVLNVDSGLPGAEQGDNTEPCDAEVYQ